MHFNTLARNFYLQKDGATTSTQQDVGDQWPSLGVWHILPKSVSAELKTQNKTTANDMMQSLNEGNETILIFFHGSNTNRIVHKKFYNGMAGLDLHILAADYRGFGDSTGNPTETGLYEDAHTIFNYVRITAPNKGIVLFGQSLGSGVATRLAADLSKTEFLLKGLILTAAFNNWNDEVSYSLKTTYSLTNYIPFFDEILRGANTRADLEVPTDRNINR
ncbi:serine aminopeptidase, s33 domain-containing protein [Ditylenchus destructor]|uniref:Serine aminopeptidase, s33 domain-containing protein n=1 Tax=Ditylenchus destructor TaxID=166010 RepID=A0AAD4NIL6_9BILA|nr:serine aminopeptidase, s33 domain-containing protein [Ditylenchus destructor]